MKKTIILSILIAFYFSSCAQNFEGIITYENKYTVQDENIDIEQLYKQYGKTNTTYYKDGYFLDLCDSDFMSYHLYRNDKKSRYFTNKNAIDTLYKISTNSKPKTELKYDLKLNADTILNYVCDKLIVYNENGSKTSFYFSSKIKLDQNLYSDFSENHKNEIVNIMKSYYLRMTYENNGFIADMIATNIEEIKLRDDIFEIPKDKYLKEIK